MVTLCWEGAAELNTVSCPNAVLVQCLSHIFSYTDTSFDTSLLNVNRVFVSKCIYFHRTELNQHFFARMCCNREPDKSNHHRTTSDLNQLCLELLTMSPCYNVKNCVKKECSLLKCCFLVDVYRVQKQETQLKFEYVNIRY